MEKVEISKQYKDILNSLLTFSVEEASKFMLPQLNDINSDRFNINNSLIEGSLTDLYTNIRELEDAKKYITLHLESEIQNKTKRCRKIIDEIKDMTMNDKPWTSEQPVLYDSSVDSFNDRNGDVLKRASVYDGKIVPFYNNLYNGLIDETKIERTEKVYKASPSSNITKGHPYRALYLLNAPKEDGITEDIIIKLKTPEVLNSLDISLTNTNIVKVETIDENNSVAEYRPNEIHNINTIKARIKEVIIKVETRHFDQVIYSKELIEQDFLNSIEEGLERKKLIDEFDRYNQKSLYLIEEMIESSKNSKRVKDGRRYSRDIEKSFKDIIGEAHNKKAEVLFQYIIGINFIRMTYKEVEENSFFLSKNIELSPNTSKISIAPTQYIGDGSIEYFIMDQGFKIDVPISEEVKNERFFKETVFEIADENNISIINKNNNLEDIKNGDIITYTTNESQMVEIFRKNTQQEGPGRETIFIDSYDEEEYRDDKGFYGILSSYLYSGEIMPESEKNIENYHSEIYDLEGYYGILTKGENGYSGVVKRPEMDTRIYKYRGFVSRDKLIERKQRTENGKILKVGAIMRAGELSQPYIESIKLIEYAGDYHE